ncbi:hypothetical protein [Alicyclobacillus vulcanalis]|uniref:hypothetical protein n=1 Tax=Alicyclobacillus vulcanalis TaxID=252246 RepID=UPI003898FD6A
MNRELRLDLYLPQRTMFKFPSIIWIHGGGWRIGDRKLAPDLKLFFAQHGFAMWSVLITGSVTKQNFQRRFKTFKRRSVGLGAMALRMASM